MRSNIIPPTTLAVIIIIFIGPLTTFSPSEMTPLTSVVLVSRTRIPVSLTVFMTPEIPRPTSAPGNRIGLYSFVNLIISIGFTVMVAIS